MEINIFDVVKLKNNEIGTIKAKNGKQVLIEIVNKNGEFKEIKEVNKIEIKEILYKNNISDRIN